jgi:hypothetical protein
MEAIKSYGYAGVGTCVGFLVGLIMGFVLSELAWCTIVCTAVTSLFGAAFDSKMKPIAAVKLHELYN